MKKVIFIISVLFVYVGLSANNNNEQISKANQFYHKAQYNEALQIYKKVLESGVESSELYYNIGNDFYKLGNNTSAILYFEKAKKLAPGDASIEHNLAVANLKVVDKIEILPQFILYRWLNKIEDFLFVDQWAIFVIIFFIIFLVSLFFFIFTRIVFVKKLSFGFMIFFLIVTISSFVITEMQYSRIKNNKEAIVFSPSVTIKSSPDEKSTDLFILHEGTKVKLIDNIGEWTEIKMPNGTVGWLKITSLEAI